MVRICNISQPNQPGAFDRVAKFDDVLLSQSRALLAIVRAIDPRIAVETVKPAVDLSGDACGISGNITILESHLRGQQSVDMVRRV